MLAGAMIQSTLLAGNAADQARWRRLAQRMAGGLAGRPGVTATYHDGGARGTTKRLKIRIKQQAVTVCVPATSGRPDEHPGPSS